MAIKAATVINKEKDSVTTTISIDGIISEIAETMDTAKSGTWDILFKKIANLESPQCKIIEFPELCYRHIKDKIPIVKSDNQQKILEDIAKIVIIRDLLTYIDSYRCVQSFFLVNSKKADFLNQVKALEKEIKYLLDIYKWPFLSINNKRLKDEINLNPRETDCCLKFLLITEHPPKYKPSSIPNMNPFCRTIVEPLFGLAKKDLKTYENCLMNGYIYESIKSDIVLDSFLGGLYKMKIGKLKGYCEQVKIVLIQVFLATYKENTNFKNDELKKFLLKLTSGMLDTHRKELQSLAELYDI